MSKLPLVVEIKRHSLEDGPGVRSVVFFKGCPLRCSFCQNPETQDPGAEMAYYPNECTHCGACEAACGREAIDLELPGRINRVLCDGCGRCAKVCQGGALRLIGCYYPVESLTEILLRDLTFYRHSSGGVTLSGGECTLFPDYLERLLWQLKAKEVHITIETSGHFDYGAFRRQILPYVDLVYFDVKIANRQAHREHLGLPNDRILDNLRRLLKEPGVAVQPRVPIVPGITATGDNLSEIVAVLYEAGASNVSLLPYNPLGLEMLGKLGRSRPALPAQFMKPAEESEIREMFKMILEDEVLRHGLVACAERAYACTAS